MSKYRVTTSIDITVYVEDGKVTGIDSENGWHEPTVEDMENDEEVDFDSDEGTDVLAALTGNWHVEQVA